MTIAVGEAFDAHPAGRLASSTLPRSAIDVGRARVSATQDGGITDVVAVAILVRGALNAPSQRRMTDEVILPRHQAILGVAASPVLHAVVFRRPVGRLGDQRQVAASARSEEQCRSQDLSRLPRTSERTPGLLHYLV